MKVIKRSLAIFLIAIISILGLTGCIYDKKEETKTNSTSVNETKVKEVDYSPYYELINTVTTGLINGFTDEQIRDMDVSVVFFEKYYRHLNGYGNINDLGYTIKDIDGNGVNELIFGFLAEQNDDKELGCNGILDIYTIRDGKLAHVLDGWERCHFRIRNDGVIVNRGSGGASTFGCNYFEYKNDTLTQTEEVFRDYENWFYSNERKPAYYRGRTGGLGDTEDINSLQRITKEQGERIIASNNRDYIYIEFTPFVPNN